MTQQRRLRVDGMKCDGCKSAVEAALSDVDGVEGATASPEEATAVVRAQPSVSDESLVNAIEDAGFDAEAP